MWMFALILQLTYSRHEYIGMGNFSYLMNSTRGAPIFIRLWTTWCPHCRKFEPDWIQLTQTPEVNKSVMFASIECDASRALCKKFEGENYPRLYWYDTESYKVDRYFGERSVSHMTEFIKKQFSPTLLEINNNQTELDVYINRSNSIPAFVLYLSSKIDAETTLKYKETYVNISHLFRRTELPFIVAYDLNETTKPVFGVFAAPDYFIEYSGDFFNMDYVTDFITKRSFSYHTELNGYILKSMELYDYSYLMSIERGNPEPNDSLLRELHNVMPLTTLNCSTQNGYFCKYFGVDKGETERMIGILDWKGKHYWIYRGEMNIESIKNWIKSVSEGKIKGSGPGTGFLSNFKSYYYEYRAGGSANVLINFAYVPLAVVIVLSIFIIMKNDVEEERKHTKKMLEKQKARLEAIEKQKKLEAEQRAKSPVDDLQTKPKAD